MQGYNASCADCNCGAEAGAESASTSMSSPTSTPTGLGTGAHRPAHAAGESDHEGLRFGVAGRADRDTVDPDRSAHVVPRPQKDLQAHDRKTAADVVAAVRAARAAPPEPNVSYHTREGDDHGSSACSAARQKYANSRHSLGPGCDAKDGRVLPFLVTCMGPCASHHLAWSLWHGGVRTQHEYVEAEGSVSWMLAVDDRCCGPNDPHGFVKAPNRYPGPAKHHFNRHHGDVFNRVLLQMRCPLQVIMGFSTFLPSSFRHVRQAGLGIDLPTVLTRTDCPLGGNDVELGRGTLYCQFGTTELDPSKLPRAVLYFFIISYIKWVSHIERYADFTYRVEDTTIYDVCTATSTSIWATLHGVIGPIPPPVRTVVCALPGANAHRTLIGACNPILCPNWDFRHAHRASGLPLQLVQALQARRWAA